MLRAPPTLRLAIAILATAACGGEGANATADAMCIARAGNYDVVHDLASATGNCPDFIVEWFGNFGPVTVNPDRPCGHFAPGGGFAVDCAEAGCGGSVSIAAIADADGIRDGTMTLESSCADEDCGQLDEQCTHTIPVRFVLSP